MLGLKLKNMLIKRGPSVHVFWLPFMEFALVELILCCVISFILYTLTKYQNDEIVMARSMVLHKETWLIKLFITELLGE